MFKHKKCPYIKGIQLSFYVVGIMINKTKDPVRN